MRRVESSLAPPVDEERGLQVIERVAVGRSLEQIAEVPGLPSKETFLIWLALSPALAQAYKAAQEVSAYALEDEVMAMLRKLRDEGATPARIRSTQMLAEHLRWAAEKRNPRVYAKQAQVTTQIPIQINTTLDMGEGGVGTGTKDFPNIYELKAAKVEVVSLVDEDGAPKYKLKAGETPEKAAHRRAIRAGIARRQRAKKKAEKEAALVGSGNP